MKKFYFFLFILLAILSNNCILAQSTGNIFSTSTPKVLLSKADYMPGETAIISGSGFQSGETLTLQILHNPTCCDDNTSAAHQSWTVIADANGNISSSWMVPGDEDELGATLQLTAKGLSGELEATANFSDATSFIYVGSFNVGDGPCWPSAPATYTAREAAALIFGGVYSDYAVSVNSNTTDETTITHSAWLDGYANTTFLYTPNSEDFKQGAVYTYPSFSAYVHDNSGGNNNTCGYNLSLIRTNYVWKKVVQSITSSVNANNICPSNNIIVSFIANGVFSANNVFTAQLSDGSGSFANPINIGNTSSTVSGSISATIPANTTAGTNYRIRVVSNNPAITGSDNGSNITVNALPAASVSAGGPTTFCPTGSVVLTSSVGDSYLWSTGATTSAITVNSSGSYFVKVTTNGCSETSNATSVTVEDNTKPTVVTQNITVQLDASGAATITPAQINNGSTDNCTTAADLQLALDKTTFDCNNIGDNTVTLTVTDANGNSQTGTATVTVEDKIKPTVVTQNITVQLDANGAATITPAQINNGSTDNCTAAPNLILALDKSTFDCSNIGNNTVTLTVTDANGNAQTGTATVTVQDQIKPTVVTQNITIQLDANGAVTITPAQINNGSTDNCTAGADLTLALDKTTFDCSNVGDNIVTLTLTDANGNSQTGTATVTVKDEVKPTVVTQNITVQLDANGAATITPAQINNGSTDNCTAAAGLQLALDKTTFDCSNIGNNTVTLTVTDANGNSQTGTATVTVKDEVKPTVVTQNITVQLDANGAATITPAQINNGSTDNCTAAAGLTLALDKTTFDCSNIGNNTVILTVTDANGNAQTGTATVTVQDQIKPTVVTQNITVQLDANGAATITPAQINNGSTDNCSIPSTGYSLSKSSFDCSNVGDNTVTLTVTDANGNAQTGTATVTVQDKINPVTTCKSIDVYLGMNGTVTITPQDVDNGSSDNCSVSLSIDKSSFNTTNVGPNNVVLTATDPSGNHSSCTTVVTVKQRPTTLTYTGDGSEQYSDQQLLTAVLTDQLTGTVLSGETIHFTIGSQSASGSTNTSGIANASLVLTQDPALTYSVVSSFAGDAIYLPASDNDAFDILQEDARAYYSGALFASTSGATSSNAVVTLSATIRDITAETSDPAYDPYPGDIRNATVTFYNRDNNTVIATVPVGLVSATDLKTGTATYNWNVNIGTANSQTYTIGIIVTNYYTRNSSIDNTVVTVSKPLDDFITGGGYIKLQSSAGIKAGDPGSNNNFGFNVKYNKSNTNLQGNINTIIRRTESGVLRVYQVKGNSITSLSVNSTISSSHPYPTAIFNGKASITDITNPLAPLSVDGNATLQVTMTDAGDPGASDKIGITVWNKSGGLWFSSNWNGKTTVEQLLGGGNLVVRKGGSSLSASVGPVTANNITNIPLSILKLEAFPNPTINSFKLVINSSNRIDKITLVITDVLGRVKEIRNNINAGEAINAGGSYPTGIYFAIIKQGQNYRQVKLIKGDVE